LKNVRKNSCTTRILALPAARLKLSELPDVLTALGQFAGEYLPEATFTQRVQVAAIRLGLAGEQAGP
jgi:hypothetical protein